jgi:peptidoglycan hydrolase-like protein with peptidoglycan-binding domain
VLAEFPGLDLGRLAFALWLHDNCLHHISREIVQMSELPLVPGDSGALVVQMQGALIKNGYSCGAAGANGDFNDDTLTALEAFQDNSALPVQAECDQECWSALGLPGPDVAQASR